MSHFIEKGGLWLATLYSLASAALLVHLTEWSGIGNALFAFVVLLWMAAPITVLAIVSARRPIQLAFGYVLSVVAGYIYWRAFFGPDLDPQSPLILIFLPIAQWLGVLIIVLLGWLGRKAAARERES